MIVSGSTHWTFVWALLYFTVCVANGAADPPTAGAASPRGGVAPVEPADCIGAPGTVELPAFASS